MVEDKKTNVDMISKIIPVFVLMLLIIKLVVVLM